MKKKYLNVAYDDRDLAKKLGAKWDPAVKRWYCLPGSPLAKIFTWRNEAASGSGTPISTLPKRGGNFELPLAS